MKKKVDLIQGSPAKSLLIFAIPMILGNLFQQFYNMADSMIVGNFVSEQALAAVGASYSLTNVFIMIAIGGGNGAAVLTSQYLGAGQYDRMKTSIYTALLTFLGLSIGLGAFGWLMNHGILTALDTPPDVLAQAELYLGIYFIGLPFLFMYNVLASVFHAMGDSGTPLYLLIFSSVLNVILDIVSVTWLHMDVDGVAYATVLAQGISAAISFGLLLRRLRQFPEINQPAAAAIKPENGLETGRENKADYTKADQTVKAKEKGKPALYDRQMLLRGTRIAVPTILQQSIVSIGMLLVQSVINGFGSGALAGYSAGSRIESIAIVPMIAAGNAVATFTAQNIGAGQLERVKKGYHASYGIVIGFAVLIAVILTCFNRQIILGFLGSEPSAEALATGTGYLSFMAFFFVWIGLKASVDGVLRGAGDMTVFTIANLVNLTIRVVFAKTMAPVIGAAAVWYAVPIGWIANYLISGSRYLTGKWKQKRVI